MRKRVVAKERKVLDLHFYEDEGKKMKVTFSLPLSTVEEIERLGLWFLRKAEKKISKSAIISTCVHFLYQKIKDGESVSDILEQVKGKD